MTAEREKKEESKAKEITFTCKFCQRSRPLDEMVVITRFFPPLVACQDCEKRVR